MLDALGFRWSVLLALLFLPKKIWWNYYLIIELKELHSRLFYSWDTPSNMGESMVWMPVLPRPNASIRQ